MRQGCLESKTGRPLAPLLNRRRAYTMRVEAGSHVDKVRSAEVQTRGVSARPAPVARFRSHRAYRGAGHRDVADVVSGGGAGEAYGAHAGGFGRLLASEERCGRRQLRIDALTAKTPRSPPGDGAVLPTKHGSSPTAGFRQPFIDTPRRSWAGLCPSLDDPRHRMGRREGHT